MLSVMMCVRNEETFISRAIGSILDQQSPVPIEVIVVDDRSTDGTARIVAGLIAQGLPIRMVQGPGCGIAAARNAALAAIGPQTQFVSFLDGDDMWPAERLVQDLALFDADPDLQIVYGRARLVPSLLPDLREAVRPGDAVDLGVVLAVGLFRIGVIRQAGSFDLRFVQSEDFDFLLRIFERAPRISVVDRVMMLYRRHPGNMTNRLGEVRRYFLMAMLEHVKRRKADPTLVAVDWIWGNGTPRLTGADVT